MSRSHLDQGQDLSGSTGTLPASAFPLLAPTGAAATPSYSFSGLATMGFYASSSDKIGLATGGALSLQMGATGGNGYIAFWNAAGSQVVSLELDSANGVLAQKNAATAQELRIYGTTTGPKFAFLTHNGTISIVADSGGAGIRLGSSGGKVGFYGTAPISLQTGVAVSAAGIHAACVALGLFTA